MQEQQEEQIEATSTDAAPSESGPPFHTVIEATLLDQGTWWLVLTGVLLALIGDWGAWVPHRAAALVRSGWDLAEFVKFVPGAAVPHELFFLPAWCAGVALGVLAGMPGGGWVRRGGLVGVALGLMVAILPPYPDLLNGYRSAEFRWHFILGFGGGLIVFLSLFSGRWPRRTVGGLLVVLALVGTVPALWQFLQVQGEIEAVYGTSLGWGWGLGPFLVGWGLVGMVGGWLLMRGPDRF